MENASKALMMAAGVLIALLILATVLSTFNNISSLQKTKLTEEEQAQIIAFNEQYTKYLGKYVYETEVITLNNKYNNDKKVKVILQSGEWPDETDNQYEYNQEDNSYSNETKYYKCIAIGYDEVTGRVNSITFNQIEMSAEIER